MPDCKLYRQIAVADLPDTDWVALQAVPGTVPDVYSLWPGRRYVEVSAVWWRTDTDVAVHDAAALSIRPVETKHIDAADAVAGVDEFDAVVNAAPAKAVLGFEKASLEDTSAGPLYLRVAAATAPGTATHLRLLVEVTP